MFDRDAVLSDPALRRTIEAIAARQSRKATQSDRAEARKDLEQELWKTALELFESFRGDGGAKFPTYCHRAFLLTAFRALASTESPVHLAKHKKRDAWGIWREEPRIRPDTVTALDSGDPRTPTDAMDLLPCNDNAGPDDSLSERQVEARLDVLLAKSQVPEAVRAVLVDDESCLDVASRLGAPVARLRAAVRKFKARAQKDPVLRAAWAAQRA